MRFDLVLLCLAYVLSQFFRTFLAVLTDVLDRDVGASPEDLAAASGLWFLTFAAMQLPVGWALDRLGPRRTSAWLLAIGGGGGAGLFAFASAPEHISAAMVLIGVGCSPVLMASYYILARDFQPRVFASLAALILGVGSVGNLAAALPTTLAVEAFGWRAVVAGLAVLSALVAVLLYVFVKDPERPAAEARGSVFDILKMPAMWLIFPLMAVQYAPSGGARGLWIGPYFREMFGAPDGLVGTVTLVMGAAMILGTFAYGPLDRLLGTRKWIVVVGNTLLLAACVGLAALSQPSLGTAIALFAALGFMGATFPLIMAHGRSFFPDHLVGRGVTMLNLFGIGGVGLTQMATGRLYESASGTGTSAGPYQLIFGLYGALLAFGLVIYLFSQDRTD